MYLSDDDIDFDAYLSMTDHEAKVKEARVWVDELEEELVNPPVDRSVLLPWGTTIDSFAFRPGEVTVWAGSNGSGKLAKPSLRARCAPLFVYRGIPRHCTAVSSLQRVDSAWRRAYDGFGHVLSPWRPQ